MSTQSSSVLIGYLSEIRNNGMDARIADEYIKDTSRIIVDNEEILVGHLGSYVAIRQANINILAVVVQMWEVNRFDNADMRKTDRFIALAPVGEILDDGTFSRGVTHYPTSGAKVYAVGITEVSAIFSKYQKYKFCIGQLSSHKEYHLGLDPQVFFSRHFAIVGQSGSGKSWTVTKFNSTSC